MNFEVEPMALVHFFPTEFEVFGGSFAGEMIPAIAKKNSTDVDKKTGNGSPTLVSVFIML